MNPYFDRVAIIGVGLLGASLGLALKARGMAGHVAGAGHRQSSLDTALAVGAADSITLNACEAVRDAALVVVCTPAGLVIPKLDEIQRACAPHAVITDVASTKRAICAHAAQAWPKPRRFVGSHPMAGSEKFGAEHGQANLYEKHVCLVEQSPGLDSGAQETVRALWLGVGARVVDVDPAEHDAMLACTSHIPHVVSSALATLAGRRGDIRAVIGNGFRDMTRIAASRPEVWRDICVTNQEAVLEGLREMQQDLSGFIQVLEAGDAAAIEAFFREGAEARKKAVHP